MQWQLNCIVCLTTGQVRKTSPQKAIVFFFLCVRRKATGKGVNSFGIVSLPRPLISVLSTRDDVIRVGGCKCAKMSSDNRKGPALEATIIECQQHQSQHLQSHPNREQPFFKKSVGTKRVDII